MVIIPDFTADTRQGEKNTGKCKENVRSNMGYTKKRFYKSKNNKIKKQKNIENILTEKKIHANLYKYENKEEYPLSP